jgi:hypothetical protein
MQINLTFDSQASTVAPQSFRDAIQAAANILDSTFADNITVNLAIGYGDLPSGGAVSSTGAEGGPTEGQFESYSATRNLLAQSLDPAVQSGVAALPAGSSVQGESQVVVWAAELKALGLLAPQGSINGDVDGEAGFGTAIPTSELVGVALHELTHAMGRAPYTGAQPDILDLFRFSGAGARVSGNQSPPASPSYFSLNNGAADLADYGQTSDPGDWLNPPSSSRTPNDSFNEFYSSQTLQSLTQLDILQMEALGFHVASTQPSAPMPPNQFNEGDVVFRQIPTGDWGYMTPNSGGGETWTAVGPSSVSYAGIGAADFNGDGLRDVAFRNITSGDWGILTPAIGGGGETWHAIGPTSTSYAAAAVADFNHDGATDVAFRNTSTGDMGYMSVNPAGGEIWHPVGPTSIGYAAMGAGDFSGDGVMDVAFRSTSTGAWGYMSVNPGGGETWHDVGPTSLAYQAIGVGDFDGQGRAEVAFRNSSTGDWGYMSANVNGGETWHPVGPTSAAYNPVQVSDLSGDGLSAIAFVNPITGDFGYMEANVGGGETWRPAGPTSTDYLVIA